jgi:hypothetical protein
MDETSKLQLTPEQVELAQAKENLQNALGEINNELRDITKYLPNVDRAKQLDFVHGDLVRIQEIMDNYLYAAKCSLQTYSLTRKRLISFADKDDIFFIPCLLTPTKHNVQTVLQVLKELKTFMHNHKNSETLDLLEEVISSYYFFKRYYKTLSGMCKEYEKLYDEIYHCEKEEYGKRFVGQSLSYRHQLKTAVGLIMHEHDPLIDFRSVFGIDSNELIVIDGETRTPFTIENLGVVARNKKVSMTTRLECDMDALARMQYSIKESIKQMIPNITEEEFSDETNLAFRIHSEKLLHHQVNSVIGGYYQLHYLDSVKNELYAQVKPQKKRGPKKCTDFEIFDKDMLREVFQMNYETEKSNFHGGSVNNYAGAFLIAMFRGEADKACLRVAPFSRLLNRLLTKFQLCERTVQEFINRYNFICSKNAKFMTNAILKCKEVVSRLIPKLEAAKLIFA